MSTRADRIISWAAAAAIAAAAVVAAVLIVRARAAAGGTPAWDAASHGEQGYAVAQDLRHVGEDLLRVSLGDLGRDLGALYTDVIGHQYRYPPVHPLLLAPAYGIFGPGWMTAIGASAALFAGLAVLLFCAGRAVASAPCAAEVVGLPAACLALTSPALIGLGGTIMLETPAAAWGAAAIWLYARSLKESEAPSPKPEADNGPGAPRAVFWTGWALTAFTLTATQYAACWLAVIASYEAWRCPADLRARALAWGRSHLRAGALRHPLHALIVLACAAAVVVAATGGWKVPLGGKRVLSVTSPFDPLIVALWAIGLRGGWLAWRHRDALRAAVPARYRAWFATMLVPLFVWFVVLYPPRLRLAANWVEGSPAPYGVATADYWTFYPRVFFGLDPATAAHASPAVAAVVLALAAAAFLRRDVSPAVRFLRWGAVCTTALIAAHPARQERFLLPFLPVWWLLAADTAAAAWRRARPGAIRGLAGLAVAGAAAGAFVPAVRTLYGEALPALVAPPPQFRAYERVLTAVADCAETAPAVRVVGTFDGLSHHLFEWELRRRLDRRYRPPQFELDSPHKKFPGDPEGPRKVFDAWLAKSPEDVVFALEPIDLETRERRPVAALGKHEAEWAYYTMRFLRETDRYAAVDEPRLRGLVCKDVEGSARGVRMYRRKP